VKKKDIRCNRKWGKGVALHFRQNDQHDNAVLCGGYQEHLTNVKSKNNDGNLMWQCFTCKKLTDLPQPIQLWIMLPREFPEWWINYARDVLKMRNMSLRHPEAVTRDGTVMIQELKNMTTNLLNGRIFRQLGRNIKLFH
jgi:hypothetical protein